MQFEIGKYYTHPSGEQMSIVGEVETTLYGKCLIAESSGYADLKPVGKDESSAENWAEISKEEWMKNFS
jgi:hypothetical protein